MLIVAYLFIFAIFSVSDAVVPWLGFFFDVTFSEYLPSMGSLYVAMLLSSLYRACGDLNLSSNTGLDRLLAEDDIPLGANGTRATVGLPKLSPTEVDMSTRNTTVKFEDGSDDESINGTESEVSKMNSKKHRYIYRDK